MYEEWAERQALPLGHKVGHFEWCDDFAAARNAANALLETDWLCWADCDDVVVDADRLRRVVAALPADAAVVAFPCDDYYEGSGTLICPRLFRSGRVVWRGRVHEGPSWRQGMRYDMVDGEHLPRWQHRCRDLAPHRERNVRILERWIRDEPDNTSPFALLVAEAIYMGDRAAAVRHGTDFVERFGHAWSDKEREIARWAIDGIRLGVDESYPTHFHGMNALLQPIVNGTIRSQAAIDLDREYSRDASRTPPADRTEAMPKTRQQRRAEARKRAKVPAR